MLKYLSYAIVMQEIPDEITLAIQITGCPHNCVNCHSPELAEDIGTELTKEELTSIIEKYINKGITCVCFMGGDKDHNEIKNLGNFIRSTYPDLKTALYSGDNEIDLKLVHSLDYYKIGEYNEERGPLNSKTTNQQLYTISRTKNLIVDITDKFWK